MRQFTGLALDIVPFGLEFLVELPRHGDAHPIVKCLVGLQVFPNILKGNLIGPDAGTGIVLVHEIADYVLLSDVVRLGELAAVGSFEVEAGRPE